jgi:hypothetical protein
VPKPQHRISEITHLALVKLERVPDLPHRREPTCRLLVAAIGGMLPSGRTGTQPLDLCRGIAEPYVGVVLVASLDLLPRSPSTTLVLQSHGYGGRTGWAIVDYRNSQAAFTILQPSGMRMRLSRST